jgi:ribonuclease VapC
MFIDASAIVAILTGEPEQGALLEELDGQRELITSAISVWEAAAAISRKSTRPAAIEWHRVTDFLSDGEVDILSIDIATVRAALAAFDRYGRRTGHPAQLNMGDCFAYAIAKKHGMPLLYVGNDFSQTDEARHPVVGRGKP